MIITGIPEYKSWADRREPQELQYKSQEAEIQHTDSNIHYEN